MSKHWESLTQMYRGQQIVGDDTPLKKLTRTVINRFMDLHMEKKRLTDLCNKDGSQKNIYEKEECEKLFWKEHERLFELVARGIASCRMDEIIFQMLETPIERHKRVNGENYE